MDPAGRTLGQLAKCGDVESVRRKIRWEGKSPNDPEERCDGNSPLFIAASAGDVPLCAALLEPQALASVEWKHHVTGSSALLAAALGRHDEALGLLLRHGADVCETNNLGLSPLVASAMKGSPACVHLLLHAGEHAGLDVQVQAEVAVTAAAKNGHADTIAVLRRQQLLLCQQRLAFAKGVGLLPYDVLVAACAKLRAPTYAFAVQALAAA